MDIEKAHLINHGKTAELLGISKATIRNWIKHGYLNPSDAEGKHFRTEEVLKLKSQIAEGTIDRLKKRANKVRAEKNFVPTEYIKKEEHRQQISHLVDYIITNDIEKRVAVFVLALNRFRLKGDLKSDNLSHVLAFPADIFPRNSVYCELREFLSELEENKISLSDCREALEYIFTYPLPSEMDVLGVIYQSLINEGKKASLGSYFTPLEIVEGMVLDNIKSGQKVIDPCCGTGQFLLSFADRLEPKDIYGIDVDHIAVRIARLNLLLKIDRDFSPQVYHLNTLQDLHFHDTEASLFPLPVQTVAYDFIGTNPPWGAEISKETLYKLRTEFPDITSGESFSYFLKASLSLLKSGGQLSFVLPEAILNVRTHADIRKYILNNCQIKKIECLGKRFKNVLSSVIRMDLVKVKPQGNEELKVINAQEEYTIRQSRFLTNTHFVFDVYLNNLDEEIMAKVYKTDFTTLQGQADWALGIVTGDNHKFLEYQLEEGNEPIYKGSDVGRFTLNKTNTYIHFTPKAFQQVAPEEKYRSKAKLIYRFISNTPVFAYDELGSLTLNSANILIPKGDYPIKVILALFNSSLYSFLYMKKFNSIKILRGDLEQLPLPLWNDRVFTVITEMVNKIIESADDKEKISALLDEFIMDQFELSAEERSYITSCLIRGNNNGKTKEETHQSFGTTAASREGTSPA